GGQCIDGGAVPHLRPSRRPAVAGVARLRHAANPGARGFTGLRPPPDPRGTRTGSPCGDEHRAMIALYPYQPRSFLTVLGSLAAVRHLKKKGFPENLRNWRFVTLTIDRSEYPDPAEAYDVGTRHLRE